MPKPHNDMTTAQVLRKAMAKKMTVSADPAWLANNIVNNIRASDSREDLDGWKRILTGYLTRLADTEAACQNIVDYYNNMSGNPNAPIADKYWLKGALMARSALTKLEAPKTSEKP